MLNWNKVETNTPRNDVVEHIFYRLMKFPWCSVDKWLPTTGQNVALHIRRCVSHVLCAACALTPSPVNSFWGNKKHLAQIITINLREKIAEKQQKWAFFGLIVVDILVIWYCLPQICTAWKSICACWHSDEIQISLVLTNGQTLLLRAIQLRSHFIYNANISCDWMRWTGSCYEITYHCALYGLNSK